MDKPLTPFLQRWWKSQDYYLWFLFLALIAISVVTVSSAIATLTYQQESFSPITSHLFYLAIGFVGAFIVSLMPVRSYNYFVLLYPIVFVMLALVFLGLGQKTNNAERWIAIGSFSFQPSEALKPILVIMGALFLSKPGRRTFSLPASKRRKYNESELKSFEANFKKEVERTRVLNATLYLVFCGVPILMVAKDNLSTALMMFFFMFLMYVIANVPRRFYKRLGVLLGLFVICGGLFFLIIPNETLDKYLPRRTVWENRITEHFNHKDYTEAQQDSAKFAINGNNFQSAHAKMAVASGGLFWGKGPGNSFEKDILPQAYSDFIYAIIAEEYGVMGMLIVASIYILFFFRVERISRRIQKNYRQYYLLVGMTLIYTLQALLNMLVAVGLFPVTGQTLPMISRGGSSALVTGCSFGVILGLAAYIKREKIEKKQQVELATLEVEEPAKSEDEVSRSLHPSDQKDRAGYESLFEDLPTRRIINEGENQSAEDPDEEED